MRGQEGGRCGVKGSHEIFGLRYGGGKDADQETHAHTQDGTMYREHRTDGLVGSLVTHWDR